VTNYVAKWDKKGEKSFAPSQRHNETTVGLGNSKSGRANRAPTRPLKSNVPPRRGEKSFARNPNAAMKKPSSLANHRMAQPCDYL
jgi:hypothetical protein